MSTFIVVVHPIRSRHEYPSLTLEEIYATILYYYHNQGRRKPSIWQTGLSTVSECWLSKKRIRRRACADFMQLDAQKDSRRSPRQVQISQMSNLVFLLDENIGHSLRDALSQHWPEMVVWAVGDPGVPRTQARLIPTSCSWCEAQQFCAGHLQPRLDANPSERSSCCRPSHSRHLCVARPNVHRSNHRSVGRNLAHCRIS